MGYCRSRKTGHIFGKRLNLEKLYREQTLYVSLIKILIFIICKSRAYGNTALIPRDLGSKKWNPFTFVGTGTVITRSLSCARELIGGIAMYIMSGTVICAEFPVPGTNSIQNAQGACNDGFVMGVLRRPSIYFNGNA